MKEVQEKLTSSLDDFCSVLGVKELDSFFANYKSSRDNSSKQLAHPCPRSPSGRPSMMQKMLGTAGINIKLAIAAGDSIHSGNKGKSQFTQSVNYQLDCLLNLDLRSIECADKLTQMCDIELVQFIDAFNDKQGIGQDAVTSNGWLYNGGQRISLDLIKHLVTMQLFHYATLNAFKLATKEERKEGNICTFQNETPRKYAIVLRTIVLEQGKDIHLEKLMTEIMSIDLLCFCATIVEWLEYNEEDDVDSDEEVSECNCLSAFS